jgi:hypothetical protein
LCFFTGIGLRGTNSKIGSGRGEFSNNLDSEDEQYIPASRRLPESDNGISVARKMMPPQRQRRSKEKRLKPQRRKTLLMQPMKKCL